MKLATMTTREQMLVLIASAVLLGSGYGLLRYRPALKVLAALQEQTKETQDRLKSEALPTPPDEDAATLKNQMDDTAKRLETAKNHMADFEQNLPKVDSQEIKLKLSELAQSARLLVRENDTFQLTAALAPQSSGAATTPTGGTRAARRAARAAAKEARADVNANNTALTAAAISTVPVTPGYGLDLLERYSQPGYTRPMQRMSMQGYYADIRYFLNELQKLPWPVTVAQLKIETDTAPTEPGMPQPLRATLILAL